MKRIRFVYLVSLYTASLLNAQDPYWDWVMPFYSPDEERATAVASDPGTGEVYLAGEWRGDLMVAFPDGVSESTDFTTTFGGIDGAVTMLQIGYHLPEAINPDNKLAVKFKILLCLV